MERQIRNKGEGKDIQQRSLATTEQETWLYGIECVLTTRPLGISHKTCVALHVAESLFSFSFHFRNC